MERWGGKGGAWKGSGAGRGGGGGVLEGFGGGSLKSLFDRGVDSSSERNRPRLLGDMPLVQLKAKRRLSL